MTSVVVLVCVRVSSMVVVDLLVTRVEKESVVVMLVTMVVVTGAFAFVTVCKTVDVL